jgi:hypothetical protein
MSFHLTPKAGPAAGNSPIGELLRKPFTALLLTGSAARAEAAVSEAIHSLSEPSADALLHEAVAVSVREPAELPPRSGDEVESAAMLPGELRRVLAWPREDCARVLQREKRQVEENAQFAALTLAGLDLPSSW